MLVPFPLFKRLHDRHHAFTNDPDQDPDHFSFGHKWYQVLLNCFYIPIQYHWLTFTKLKHVDNIRATYPTTIVYFSLVVGALSWIIVSGYIKELIFLLVIPNAVAILVLALFFDYIPHHPHKSIDRYHDSRIYPSRVLNLILLGQNYHLVHHMYPRVPWYKYKEVYEKILPDLEANNAPIEDLAKGIRPKFMRSPNTFKLLDDGRFVKMLLPVSAIKTLTKDSRLIEFQLPKGETLKFKAGQYIVVRKWIAGKQHSRCYSICNPAGQESLKIAVRAHSNGIMSNYLNHQLSVGDELIIEGPFGDFYYPATNKSQNSITEEKQLILIAGGSGITPILAIIETALSKKSCSAIHLLYANRTYESVMFHQHIKNLQKNYPEKFKVTLAISSDTQQQTVGRLNHKNLDKWFNEIKHFNNSDYYICGPKKLNQIVKTVLKHNDIATEKVHSESYTSELEKPQGTLHQVEVRLANGQQIRLPVASNQTVLSVAIDEGLNIPNACGQGTCGTCKLKVLNGRVKPIAHSIPGMTQDEQKAGYTLSCQCLPESDLTLIEI